LASGRKAAQQGDGFRKRSTHPTNCKPRLISRQAAPIVPAIAIKTPNHFMRLRSLEFFYYQLKIRRSGNNF